MFLSIRTAAFIGAVASLLNVASGLGINCDGSGNCGGPAVLPDLATIIEEYIDPNRFYNNGEQIVCEQTSGVCAFCQNSGGAPGSSIITLIGELANHGCKDCGSIPLFYPQDNNVDDGELTVNFVKESERCSGQLEQIGSFLFNLCN